MQHGRVSSQTEPHAPVPVQRAVGPTAPMQREVGLSSVVPRDSGTGAVVQRDAGMGAVVHREVGVSAVVQRTGASVPVQRDAGMSAVAQGDAGTSSVVPRDVGMGAVVQRDAGVSAVVQRNVGPGVAGQREVGLSPVQRDGGVGVPVQREAVTSVPVQRVAGTGVPVQRVAGTGVPVQRDVGLSAVVQREGEGGGGAVGAGGLGWSGQQVAGERQGGVVPMVVQRAAVAGAEGQVGLIANRTAELGPVAQRAVEAQALAQRVAPVAELLWPPREGAGTGSVVPLSSAEPLTVPEVQQPTNAASVPPAVQRVVFDHPGLRAPSSGRTTPAQPTKPTEVQAPVGQPEGRVLAWSAEDSFHEEPAVQRAETVRSVSLQQMFSGAASTQEQPTEQFAVQRDDAPIAETPAAQPVVQTAPAAQAQAQPQAPAKGVSAAEVEELAKRLYEPLTAKLKAELWLDRERAGRVTDRW
ncbi:hypothetical protein EV138_1230 [Kribbella voronezhensis]|uniref:Syndecan 1 n=2 Tax=Kribbella voronezhensis TaxID=2512212 RepID=A0A4V3FJU3_9ACTN|nr:hypothetical protein EV138_1230 [Kribbella voronezhensis]